MRRRGEIWLADLNPRRGTEPGKTRPVLIVQAQALLDADHPSTLVVPLTTRLIEAAEPLRIRIRASGTLKKDSDVPYDQEKKRYVVEPGFPGANITTESNYIQMPGASRTTRRPTARRGLRVCPCRSRWACRKATRRSG